MTLGPGPPLKKGGRDKFGRTGSKRELATAGQGSSMGSSADTTIVGEGGNPETDDAMLGRIGWNTRRYQREDEELWGFDGDDSGGFEGSSVGLSGSGGARKTSNRPYYVARNPAVNDLHPPVVSTQPTHKSETRWMLQPPPSAKIMAGKVRANRSRSGSGGSSRRGGEAIRLGRQVGERLMEEKVRRGQRPPSSHREKSTDRNTLGGARDREGQPHDRDANTFLWKKHPLPISSSESLTLPTSTPPPSLQTSSSMFELDLLSHESSAQTLALSSLAPPKPALLRGYENTALSPPSPSPCPRNPKPHHPRSHDTFNKSTGSLHILRELSVPTTSISTLNSRSNSPLPESRIKLPPSSYQEDEELIRLPECESWFPPRDFRFPGPDPQRDKAERRFVIRRSSMDF